MKSAVSWPAIVLACVLASPAAVIKEGDVLDVQVQDHPQFSGRFSVGEDGTTDYPLLPDIQVANLSVAELVNDLTFRLAKHVDNPLVMVKIVDRPEISVTVLGAVRKPGPTASYQGASVQEVIEAAGGPQPNADIERVKIISKGGGDAQAQFFDYKGFLRDGEFDKLPRLNDGDVVILLSERQNRRVKVIGAVAKPGFFDLDEAMNVFELVYLAGGPAPKADLSRVRRLSRQGGTTTEEVLNLQDFMDKGNLDQIPAVNEGDVVIVYSRWFDWPMMLTILNNVLLFIVTIQALRGAFN
jgi:protein involved in polysaccharide export with SLBB domain